jgi:hypothetical protein
MDLHALRGNREKKLRARWERITVFNKANVPSPPAWTMERRGTRNGESTQGDYT